MWMCRVRREGLIINGNNLGQICGGGGNKFDNADASDALERDSTGKCGQTSGTIMLHGLQLRLYAITQIGTKF